MVGGSGARRAGVDVRGGGGLDDRGGEKHGEGGGRVISGCVSSGAWQRLGFVLQLFLRDCKILSVSS